MEALPTTPCYRGADDENVPYYTRPGGAAPPAAATAPTGLDMGSHHIDWREQNKYFNIAARSFHLLQYAANKTERTFSVAI